MPARQDRKKTHKGRRKRGSRIRRRQWALRHGKKIRNVRHGRRRRGRRLTGYSRIVARRLRR